MRSCCLCALLLAACGATPEAQPSGAPMPLTKVAFQQYYKGSGVFVLENLAGRDMVKLRSKPSQNPRVMRAYVPDEAMRELLSQFRSFGFFDHAGARPRDPRKAGGRAELTIIEGKRYTSFVRRNRQGKAAYETYGKCVDTFRAVHAYYGRFQASSGGGDFGVKKVDLGDR